MKLQSRVGAAVLGAALGVVGAVGMAAPAFAAYSSESGVGWSPNGPVQALAVSGGQTFLGGAILDPTDNKTVIGGYVAAVDSVTGDTKWTTLTDKDVRALAVSADGGALFAGGNFVTVAGSTHKRLVKLDVSDGSVESWKASASGIVRDLLVDGSDLYVAGAFSSLNGNGERGIGKVSAVDGKNDGTFSAKTDKPVYGVAKSGSNLVLAGQFTTVNGAARPTLAEVDLTTGALASWSPAALCSGCKKFWDVTVDATRAYVASGGKGGNGFGAIDLVTGARAYYSHTDGDVQTVALGPDGLLYIGGHFNRYVGVNDSAHERHLIAAVDPATGVLDPAFTPRFFKSYPGVWALAATPSRLYAGGYFQGVFNNDKNNHQPYFAMFKTS